MNTKRTNGNARGTCTTGRASRPTSSERLRRRRSDGSGGPVGRIRSSRLSVSPCPLALSSGGGGGGVREIFQKTVVVVAAAFDAAAAVVDGLRCYERGAPPPIFPTPTTPSATYRRSFLIPGALRPLIETTKPVTNAHRRVPEITTPPPVDVTNTKNRRSSSVSDFVGSVITSSRNAYGFRGTSHNDFT